MSHSSLLLFRGGLKSRQLPEELHLWDLRDPLRDLRARSLGVSMEEQTEWGGCIVLQKDRLYMNPHHFSKGWENGVKPICLPENHKDYVGFAHIHLPDEASGRPYLGFSARDFRASLADGDNLSLVCNGLEVFALVCSVDRIRARCVIDDREFEEWEDLYEQYLEQARVGMSAASKRGLRQSDALNRALWKANQEMCWPLGFALYWGAFGEPLKCIYRL